MSVNIKFAGDVVINGIYKTESIDNNLVDLFSNSDLNIVNLECPVTATGPENKMAKTGPHIKGSALSISSFLKKLNINLVTLANNHIMDYGDKGFSDTIDFCKTNAINFTGAGADLAAAKLPFRTEINALKISILCFAENEWSNATLTNSGANPLNIVDNVNQIKEEKLLSDIVIVIIHGGNEYYNLPSPRIVKQYRFYADSGADVIIGHHTHCLGGYEIHGGTPIFYSLGNFLFTKKSDFEGWYTGLVLELEIIEKGAINFKLHPTRQSKENYNLSLLEDVDKDQSIKQIEEYKNIISEESKLQHFWLEFLLSKKTQYLRAYSPINGVKNNTLKKLFIKLGLEKFFISQKHYRNILNHIRCEAHLDASKDVINSILKK